MNCGGLARWRMTPENSPVSRVLVLRPSAKINLTLRVGGLRSDGFHEVRTLMQSIALCDRLTMSARKGPFVLAGSSPGVPVDATNLVVVAAERLWRAIGRDGDPRDVHVRLHKEIPVAAGLGGGSADAAAALVGLNIIWNGRLSPGDLVRLGAEIGSDVPFALHGGTALSAGRGEELYPVDDVPRMSIVVIKPSFGVSTAEAYSWLDADRRARPADANPSGRIGAIDLGWLGGPVDLVNDLQKPVAVRHPAIEEMVDALRRAGARAAAMTGSGSAVFGVFPGAVPRTAVRGLMRPDWLVLLTRTSDRREAARRLLL
jgi:4-diphosphocytidyl-2-C-methyl-D-erythritol kinase